MTPVGMIEDEGLLDYKVIEGRPREPRDVGVDRASSVGGEARPGDEEQAKAAIFRAKLLTRRDGGRYYPDKV
jgi:hypothetical protein